MRHLIQEWGLYLPAVDSEGLLAIGSKVLAAVAEGHLREERLGLPCVRHSQLQPIPVDSAGHGWAPRTSWWHPGGNKPETWWDRAENTRQAEEDRSERVRSSRGNTPVQRRRRTCSMCHSRYFPAAWAQVWSPTYQLVHLEVQIPTHTIVN